MCNFGVSFQAFMQYNVECTNIFVLFHFPEIQYTVADPEGVQGARYNPLPVPRF